MTAPAYEPTGTRTGRRAELRRRRRQRRRRLVAAALAVALVAAVGFVVLLVTKAPPPPQTVGEQARTQRTLLLQVQGGDGAAVASALLAQDSASTTGSAVLVPPQVIVDVPGSGSLPFGQVLSTGTPEAPRNALADLLGVTVDAGWVLDGPTFAALVDRLGGIEADVDVQVLQDQTVVVAPGTQQLDGGRALAYLTYLAPGEQEQARLARAQEVLDGVISATADQLDALVGVLEGLGERSVTTLPVTDLADVLTGLQEASAADELQFDSLPVIPIDPGGGVTAFRIDAEAARALVDRLLAQSVPSGARASGNRVLVLNGVGTPGLGDAARTRLVTEGFVFVGSRNAPGLGYETSIVLVPEATPEAQALGERVAAALGVPPDVRTDDLGTIADVIVILGADFVP